MYIDVAASRASQYIQYMHVLIKLVHVYRPCMLQHLKDQLKSPL